MLSGASTRARKAGQVFECGFRHRIGKHLGIANPLLNGTDVDDPAELLPLEYRRDLLAEENRRNEIRVGLASDLFDGELRPLLFLLNGRVVHEDVNSPERSNGLSDGPRRNGQIGDIAAQGDRPASGFGRDSFGGRSRHVQLNILNRHGAPRRGQCMRDANTDSPARAGDQRYLSIQT